MDLRSLKRSIASLPREEAEALVKDLRKNRRIEKKKFVAKKKTTTTIERKAKPKTAKQMIGSMTQQQREALLKLLEG